MSQSQRFEEFDYNGRTARVSGANIGSPSDPLNQYGTPRYEDGRKRRRMLAAKKKNKGGIRGRNR